MIRRNKHVVGAKGSNKVACRQLSRIKQLSVDNAALLVELDQLIKENEIIKIKIAGYRGKIKAILGAYENLWHSKSWAYTASIRAFLDKIPRMRYRVGQLAAYFKRFVPNVGSFFGFSCNDWVETVNHFEGHIVIMQQVALTNPDQIGQHIKLTEFLAGNGFLVIHSWCCDSRDKFVRVPMRHPAVINIPFLEFIAKAAELHPEKRNSQFLFITAPITSVVNMLPVLRSAGFTICVDIMRDWAAASAKNQADWYESVSEEHAILCADLVAVGSAALEDKFSGLRRDIICINYPEPTSNDEPMLLASRYERLLNAAIRSSYLRNIYA